ncbi:angiopoietin-1 receptor-like isoform X2 [Acanthaster planci]|uniref:receptor protein-tyrosine kinase n=1 Tax=Acanthaster planci TaxID=133434 RepID=A0A8B7YV55_ACAPL|nr:angiopoietin-1 receptor-like isoform X2 [Acanthaster planci]
MQGCNGGMFGADCKQTCHCASGDLCEEDTGKCAGNCVDPYFGENCQCATTNAVLGLDVISNDPYELRVSWLPDPCVPGYSLEYTLTNRGQCEVIKSPQPVIVPDLLDDQTTSHVITGLEAHSTYTVSLRPEYTSTQGPDVSTSVTTLLETNPSVSPVIITSYDSVSVTLSWREVNCANYSVEYALLNKEGCQPISPIIFLLHCMCSGTNVTVISDLMANSMYRMRVKAFVDGNHGSAEEKDVTTSTREPSASPANVTLLVRNKRQLSFSWSPPPCGSRGGIITGYVYKLSGRGPTILDDTAVESVTITQLIPFTNYKFQVAAKTNAGAGPYSETITGKTLEAVPTAPVNVAIQNVDDVSITVKWSEPDPPQGIITHYNVRYWKSGQTGSQTDEDVVLLVHRIPGLETNVTYTIQVQAETSVGVGPWSLDVTTTTRIGEPGPVQELHWTDRTDSTITLDWEPPISPNGQIRKYIVEYRALEKSHQPSFTPSDEYIRNEVVSAPYQKENLEPATKYDFKVSAENQLFIGFGTSLEIFTKPKSDLPAPPQPISFPDDSTDTTVTIGLTLAISGDDFTESYVIRVKKTRSSSVTKRDVLIPSHFEDSPDDYIAADLLKGGVPDRFVVGDAKLYGGYYNAPLQRGAVYNIRVGSVSRGNETEANVVYSEPLTVKVEQSSSSVGPVIAAVVLAIVLFIVVGIAAFIYWKKRRTPSPPPATTELVLSETSKAKIRNIGSSSESNTLNPDVDVYEDIGLLPSWAAQMEIRWENLVVEDVILGKGNFGEVRAGGVKMDGNVIKAAIKTLKESASETVLDDFKTELQTMTGIKPHPNVVCLLGACLHEGILYVALEFLPNGNLRDYLRKTRPNQQGSADSKDDVSPLTSKNLLNFGLDVAKGMEHLSNTGIIHRDLAARNILLSENLTAKVSDFGLSRGEDVYVQKSSTRIPVRWLAIESLTRRVYKTKSDVWSFGILLWEIATYGSTPYPGIESKSLAKRLLDGYRMPKPENCADELYNLMLRCWQEEPNDRPNFGNLVQILEEVCLVSDADIYLSPTVYQNFIIKREFDDK